MHLAVFFRKKEMGMTFKAVLFRVLKDKPSLWFQDIVAEHHIRQPVEIGQVVGRIGKDNIERGRCRMSQERKDIRLQCFHLPEIEFTQRVTDETDMTQVHLHQGDVWRAAGSKFIANASGAGKKVEHRYICQVKIILQDIEQGFFGHIGGGSKMQ